ncbi:hypothetical protein, variant 1 [Aphanomyces invadans]|uniref:FYVE-type domain-containing protein n=1 Tax=Aphanomyces invadans TaxID=157072 RepID=A0A024U8W8_9STRA|nr:hypothetical protein H310_05664 [Aphanomyces invadans]XP_008868653.1 hypothetical protein, variant 1 [Aphanomyces invadans]ETW02047.1 hypothetical protein H310_05664 [Aphanomyces invadans]ETW02048.1 hypothetical protein, variant 1 [Aphanomyces invadans]|eukprot:XP_008868652.1 hypothetical protein H310_05664 [Aphanomyces invadans]
MISIIVAGKAIRDENRQMDLVLNSPKKTTCLRCSKHFSLLRRKAICTACHEAFCKDCTVMLTFDKLEGAHRLCDFCSNAGHCLSIGATRGSTAGSIHPLQSSCLVGGVDALPTRFSEDDLIVPVLEDNNLGTPDFPIAQSGPAAHFYRTYYQAGGNSPAPSTTP